MQINNRRSPLWRGCIRATYLLPAVTWALVLICAAIPHLYFIYDGIAHETVSTFGLLTNTWSECMNVLTGSADSTPASVLFSYIMLAVAVLTWATILWHGIAAITCAICSCYAFSLAPTDRLANRAKRVFHLICPNRICYVILQFLPLPLAFFPQILTACYQSQLGLQMRLCAFGPQDWIPACSITLICTGAYLALLSAQSREHMDMFRLYKAKKDVQ